MVHKNNAANTTEQPVDPTTIGPLYRAKDHDFKVIK